MRNGYIHVYYGKGRGKTTIAIGQGIRAVGEGLRVIMIQFLDYNKNKEALALERLEPDFKVFRFEKMRTSITDLDETGKKELKNEIQTSINFTKKILETAECDMLVLDGITDAIIGGYVEESAFCDMLLKKPASMDIIITGTELTENISTKADYIYNISIEKRSFD